MLRIFAEPLSRVLHLVYDLVGHYGVAIIVMTFIVKVILIPLTVKQQKSMKNMQEIQPKIAEIQKKYKNDKETMNQKVMELYKEHNVNPFGGCLPLLIQFPIIIGLFTVLRLPEEYGFTPEMVQDGFLWVEDLSAIPDVTLGFGMIADPAMMMEMILPVLAGATTFLATKTMSASQSGASPQQQSMQKMMLYFFPIMLLYISTTLPTGLTLYWVVSNLFQTVQQLIISGPPAFLGGKRSEAK